MDRRGEFLARRLVRFALSLVGLLVASFGMIRMIPGDPVRASLGATAPADLVAARRAELGLTRPLPEQLVDYLGGVLHGDLGTSFTSRVPVADLVADRLGSTLLLALLATAVAFALAVPVGMWIAARTDEGRGRGAEAAFTVGAGAVLSIPEFLFAVGGVAVFGVFLRWLPVAGQDGPSSFVLPVAALAAGPAAVLARLVRLETLRVLNTDYLRLARAKRLPPARLYLRHVLPNTLTATLTVGGLLLSSLIAAGVLVEYVFAWPGIGTQLVQAVTEKDYPVAQALILVYGVVVLAVNFAVDVLLGIVDPRSTIREA